jgi:hypothetical protein
MSQGNVAQKRYRGMDHRGHLAILGHGCTTGHQNRSPAPKNDACSNSCHERERRARSNTSGICHTIKTTAVASQHIAGFVMKCPSRFTQLHRKDGAMRLWVIHLGNPRRSGSAGALIRIKGGAIAISKRCWTMWTVSEASSNAFSGEAIASHSKTIPPRNAAIRQVEIRSWKAPRRRSQPTR